MSDSPVIFRPGEDFSGFRLEKTVNGHLVSPWFTFELNEDERIAGAYSYWSRYHPIKDASASAFASFLSIRPDDVMVTEKKTVNGEIWWRLGTIRPMDLPIPRAERMRRIEGLVKKVEKPGELSDGAIDI